MKNVERFEITEKCIDAIDTAILIDKETGVQYLYAQKYDSGGLTVLLDENGKPLIHERYRKKTQ